MVNKKRVAREWLYFLGFTVPWGLVVSGMAFEPTSQTGVGLGTHTTYSLIDVFRGFGIVLLPYLAFLLVRSLIWSIKILKSKEKP
jgi:Na+-transporting NADH:ubiquinone oxidoreductase subunit NqrD